RGKSRVPSYAYTLQLQWAVDPLPARPTAGAGDVVVAQENFPYHAVGAGWSDLFVISNDGDGLEEVEGHIFVVSDAD
ncbi:hypothetical protein CRG98_049132, partial [Punica granatum]